jgi:uncharacterized protein (DUF1684 family)
MYADDWVTWHEAHERRRGRPYGFLAVTGLHWLSAEWQSFDDVPGEWRAGPDGVTVRLPEGEQRVDGEIRFGDVRAEVARRGSETMLRARDPQNPLRLAYRGTPAFPPDEKWVVTGRFVPGAREVTVGSTIDGVEHVYDAPGRVEFTLAGRALSLTAFPDGDGFETIFRDATSGVSTYPACRTLSIDPPAADGTVVVDFNRATNLPCAYTEFATCPLPPPENVLPIAIEAGERLP